MRIPILLSVIAGMVDLTGFLTLGMFTAHITGNLVVVAALFVRGGQINPDQILALPIFISAVAGTWLIAKASGKSGPSLMRELLLIHFLLITCLFIFSIITKPSVNPHGLRATIAAMIAVSAMACQFALLRLTLPGAPSTAVMTGNLTNVCLALMDRNCRTERLLIRDTERPRGPLYLLIGFLAGCVVAAAAVDYLGDWSWSFPAVLAAVALASS
jgi:uncharacterized membrane protein YoaK (UPF0700 family)